MSNESESPTMSFPAAREDAQIGTSRSHVAEGVYVAEIWKVDESKDCVTDPVIAANLYDATGTRRVGSTFNVYSFTHPRLQKSHDGKEYDLAKQDYADFLSLATACGVDVYKDFVSSDLVGKKFIAGVIEVKSKDGKLRNMIGRGMHRAIETSDFQRF